MITVYFLVAYFLNISTRLRLRTLSKEWKKYIDGHLLHINEITKINHFVEERDEINLIRMAVEQYDLLFLFWAKKTLTIKDDRFTLLCFRLGKKFITNSVLSNTEQWRRQVKKFKTIEFFERRYVPIYFLSHILADIKEEIIYFDKMKDAFNTGIRFHYDGRSISNLLIRYFIRKGLKHDNQVFLNIICDHEFTMSNHLRICLFDDPTFRIIEKRDAYYLSMLDFVNVYKKVWKDYEKELDYLLYTTREFKKDLPFPSPLPITAYKYLDDIELKRNICRSHFGLFFGIYERDYLDMGEWSILAFKNGEYDKMDKTQISNLVQKSMDFVRIKNTEYAIPKALKTVHQFCIIEDWMINIYIYEFGQFLLSHGQLIWLQRLLFSAFHLKMYSWIKYILPKMDQLVWTIDEKILLRFQLKKCPKSIQQLVIHLNIERTIYDLLYILNVRGIEAYWIIHSGLSGGIWDVKQWGLFVIIWLFISRVYILLTLGEFIKNTYPYIDDILAGDLSTQIKQIRYRNKYKDT